MKGFAYLGASFYMVVFIMTYTVTFQEVQRQNISFNGIKFVFSKFGKQRLQPHGSLSLSLKDNFMVKLPYNLITLYCC